MLALIVLASLAMGWAACEMHNRRLARRARRKADQLRDVWADAYQARNGAV